MREQPNERRRLRLPPKSKSHCAASLIVADVSRPVLVALEANVRVERLISDVDVYGRRLLLRHLHDDDRRSIGARVFVAAVPASHGDDLLAVRHPREHLVDRGRLLLHDDLEAEPAVA